MALRVGWIGTGVMGRWMAGHVLKAGYPLTVNNIPKERAQPLLDEGAKFLSIPELVQNSDVVVTMVGFPHELEEVIFSDQGVLKHINSGTYLIDHTTSSPSLSMKIAEEAAKKGVEAIDAPVSGGDAGAKAGQLAIMCGGNKQAFQKIKPIMEHYGSNVRLLGTAGVGQHSKLSNQIVLAGNMIGMVEGLLYGYKAGIDMEQLVDLISTGAAGSVYFKAVAPKILKGDHSPGFYVQHFVKDIGLVLDECKRLKISLPGLSLVNQFYYSMIAHGEEKLGAHALIKVLERLNNTQISS